MLRKALVLSVLGLGSMIAASSAQACGYYAIFECGRGNSDPGGCGYPIRTDNFSNFRAGWTCRVQGPFASKSQAKSAANSCGGYVKFSC